MILFTNPSIGALICLVLCRWVDTGTYKGSPKIAANLQNTEIDMGMKKLQCAKCFLIGRFNNQQYSTSLWKRNLTSPGYCVLFWKIAILSVGRCFRQWLPSFDGVFGEESDKKLHCSSLKKRTDHFPLQSHEFKIFRKFL